MQTPRSLLLTAAVLCMAFGIFAAEDQSEAGPYNPVKFLVGSCKGEGTGMGGNSKVTHTYEYVIQDKFLHMRTRSEFQGKEDQEPEEIHEDWGFSAAGSFAWSESHRRAKRHDERRATIPHR